MSSTTTHSGVTYLNSKEAGRRVGYSSDYITKLAREGKIISKRDGIQWLVDIASLTMFHEATERSRAMRKEKLREERKREREEYRTRASSPLQSTPVHSVPYVHTVSEVTFDVSHEDRHPAPSPLSAHRLTLSAVVPGVLVALVIAYSSYLTPIAERNTASLTDAVRAMAEFTNGWRPLAFLWRTDTSQGDHSGDVSELREAHRMPQGTRNGIVVLPGDATDATIQEVRDSFSDEVNVELDSDERSGTIVPVFSDGHGDEYRFIIVPVAQSP